MQKQWYAIITLLFLPVPVTALTLSQQKTYTVTNNDKQYELYEVSSQIGQLTDGTWVKSVCIKKGMIGLPNISMPSYRGKYVNKNQETCYVFALDSEGEITFKNQNLKVYRTDNEAFLSDGTKVKIDCLAPGAVAKIAQTAAYRGTYYITTPSGKRQCIVWAVEETPARNPRPIYRS